MLFSSVTVVFIQSAVRCYYSFIHDSFDSFKSFQSIYFVIIIIPLTCEKIIGISFERLTSSVWPSMLAIVSWLKLWFQSDPARLQLVVWRHGTPQSGRCGLGQHLSLSSGGPMLCVADLISWRQCVLVCFCLCRGPAEASRVRMAWSAIWSVPLTALVNYRAICAY